MKYYISIQCAKNEIQFIYVGDLPPQPKILSWLSGTAYTV
jgi:hypothetical protein